VKTPDWRSSESYAGLSHLTMREIAWEFLRRNPGYHEDYNKLPEMPGEQAKDFTHRWGLRFGVDPSCSAREAGIFWRPEVCASVILLSNSNQGSSLPGFMLSEMPGSFLQRRAEDGAHIIIRDKRYSFQLFLAASTDPLSGLQANIPLDENTAQRCASVQLFWSFVLGEMPVGSRKRSGLRGKYPQALQALDGWMMGATYREIAEVLFGAARVDENSWKTSTIRSSTIRLVKLAEDMMLGGYARLLHTYFD
jgi:hypothetical protein